MEINGEKPIVIGKSVGEIESETKLEKQRIEREAAEKKLKEELERNVELTEAARTEKFHAEFARQIKASGIEFLGDHSDLLKILQHKDATKFVIAEDGHFTVVRNGVETDFQELLEEFAVKMPYLVERDSITHLTVDKALLTKADFKTAAAKSRFISRNSFEAWSALPARPLDTYEVDERKMRAKDWANLSLAQKSQLISKYGSDFVSIVLARR